MFKKYLQYSLVTALVATFANMVYFGVQPVKADVSYSCPQGQHNGSRANNGEDIRYCYEDTGGCPAGQVRGNSGNIGTIATDSSKCYTLTKSCKNSTNANCTPEYRKEGDANSNNGKKGLIQATTNDGLVCPSGLFRGDLSSIQTQAKVQSQDKCYKCDDNKCEDAGVYALPGNVATCGFTNSGLSSQATAACKKSGQDDSKAYMAALKKAAPTKDYNFPTGHIAGSTTANTFCDYYDTPEEDRYDYRFIRQACIIGYELGFGQNRICTDRYLGILPPKPYGDFPSDYAYQLFEYNANLVAINNPVNKGSSPADSSSNTGSVEYVPGKYPVLTNPFALDYRKKITSSVLAACHDGYTQYRVDYNFCENSVTPYLPDEACKQKLRTDSRNVFDPGPIGERLSSSNQANQTTNKTVILNTKAAVGLNCGGIITAYFSCGGGNTLESSGIWNLIMIILNILVVLVSIVAVGGIVWGAIRYASSQDNSGEQQAAREFIRNVIIGLVLFVAMWAIMQYIIPGGVFR